MTTPDPRRRHAPRRRAGFTIIELLMVILIIGVLAALLIPAIQSAMIRAREAEVIVEIKGLEKGIVDFKNRFGIEPPSFIVLYEDGDASGNDPSWATDTMSGLTDAHRRASRALVRQLWPDFSFASNHDINGDGITAGQYYILNGAECLVFFLGGVTNRETLPDGTLGWAPQGFAANPQFPFVRGGNRIGPFLTFDPARLIDIDARRSTGRAFEMPEYLDTLAGQQLPYQYVSSYAGRGYQPYGIVTTTGSGADDELMVGGFGLSLIYYQSPPFITSQWISNSPPQLDLDGDGTAETTPRPFNPDTFQIVSPGYDFEYGVGGYYNGEGIPTDRGNERDNITNFKGGRLN